MVLKIIAKNVKSKLEKKVNGKVYCHFIGTTLVCDIINNGAFRYTEKYTQYEISNGITSEQITNKIIYAYLLHIKREFFK